MTHVTGVPRVDDGKRASKGANEVYTEKQYALLILVAVEADQERRTWQVLDKISFASTQTAYLRWSGREPPR